MENIVYTKSYEAPPVNKCKILCYSGTYSLSDRILKAVDDCLDEALPKLVYKVAYREMDISVADDKIKFVGTRTSVTSASLARHLLGCDRVLLFAATVGIEIDRLIARYKPFELTKAIYMHAIGTERVESLCDTFCAEIREREAERGNIIKPRFSPGYGDFDIAVQKKIFSLLDCPRQIGLTLSGSMIMAPTKSVTAVVGIASDRRE